MDITQPLQPDEALPVQTHRVVPDSSANAANTTTTSKKSSKKSKEGRDEGKTMKKKKKKKDKGEGATDDLLAPAPAAASEGDLLALDWQPVSAPAAAAPSGGGLLYPAVMPTTEKKSKKSSSSSHSNSASKSEQPLFFHSFHSSRHAEINYAIRVDNTEATSLSIAFELTNASPSSAVSAAVDVQPHALVKSITPKVSVDLARNLPPRASFASAVSITLASPLTENMTVSTILHLTTEGLVGPDVIHVSVPLKIHAVVAFAPYVLDSAAFADKLSKASSKWSKQSVTISLSSSKAKTAFKRVAEFLHAHLVESESNKAAMMAARTPSGCKVFIMCKSGGGSSGTGTVDIKCLGSSEQESAAVAAVVGAALEYELF